MVTDRYGLKEMLAPDGTMHNQNHQKWKNIRASTGACGETKLPEDLHYSASLTREIQLAEAEFPSFL